MKRAVCLPNAETCELAYWAGIRDADGSGQVWWRIACFTDCCTSWGSLVVFEGEVIGHAMVFSQARWFFGVCGMVDWERVERSWRARAEALREALERF